MSITQRRLWRLLAAVALTVLFAFSAVSCGGDDDDDEGGGTAIAGLGSDLDEIKEMAREEGQVNLVIWSGYADKSWADTFTQQTGCTVNTKDGTSSDDMVQLMSTGEYDGVSASGDATLRLIARGDVAPIDTELTPNYADVYEGLKNQEHNTVDGESYGVPHGRGPNLMVFRADVLPETTNSWDVVWDKGSQYKGKISWPDNPISIADAAVYLKATQPDLGIENPYALDQAQFDAAVNLLKQQNANIGEYWADPAKQVQSLTSKDAVVGHTWPYQMNLLEADKQPVKGIKPQGGHDRVVGHLDDRLGGAEPELHVPLDGLHHLARGEREGGRVLRRGALECEGVRAHQGPGPLHQVPRGGRVVVGGRLLLGHADHGLR